MAVEVVVLILSAICCSVGVVEQLETPCESQQIPMVVKDKRSLLMRMEVNAQTIVQGERRMQEQTSQKNHGNLRARSTRVADRINAPAWLRAAHYVTDRETRQVVVTYVQSSNFLVHVFLNDNVSFHHAVSVENWSS